jgi:YVTN family beta-propeller protein
MLARRVSFALTFVLPLLATACQQPQASPTAAPAAPPPAAPAASPAVSPSPAVKPSPSLAASPAASPAALPPEVVVTANREDRSLSIVDPVSARVLASVAVDRPVRGVAISPDQRSAFATDPSEGSRAVVVADLGLARQVGDITVGSRPDGIAAASSSGEVVVANGGDNSISFFNPQTRTPSAAVQVGATPRGVALAAVDGRPTAFVANAGDGSVSVLDIAQRRVLANVSVGGQPIAVASSIDGARLYALDGQGGNVAVIDARANQVIRSVHVGDSLTGLDTTADGRFLLIASSDATRNLYKLNVATDQVGNPLNLGAGALAVAASPRAERAYITTADNRLVIWDTSGDRTISAVSVGQRPEGVAAQVQPAVPSAAPGASPAASPRPAPAPAASPAPAVSPVPSVTP